LEVLANYITQLRLKSSNCGVPCGWGCGPEWVDYTSTLPTTASDTNLTQAILAQ